MKSIFGKLAGAVAFGAMAITLVNCGGSGFSRQYLDKYVELETEAKGKELAMNPGISVYVDFSDGMNSAYGTEVSREALKKVINVFTGTSGQADFFSLADDKITPLELKQTEIYNAIMSGANYTLPKAPIEKTLSEIVEKNQSALLITDFEEYNGNVIQQQAYAKDYFIKWLSSGRNIVFYKIDYTEKGKAKHLYFTVFDSAANTLAAQLENALKQYLGNGIERYVLGGSDCDYQLSTAYPSSTKGGNYHDSKGEDLVTGVIEDGQSEAYKNYGFSQYYPLGESWEGVVANIKALQEEGVAPEDKFVHLLSNIYVNFNVQDGYDISGVDAIAYNFEPVIQKLMAEEAPAEETSEENAEPKVVATPSIDSLTKVLDMFTASMEPAENPALQGEGWQMLSVDFDTRFTGKVPASMQTPNDLVKVDVVIAGATPRLDCIDSFFGWTGNSSLAESVRNTLNSDKVNPTGSVIVTYYLKVL